VTNWLLAAVELTQDTSPASVPLGIMGLDWLVLANVSPPGESSTVMKEEEQI
jgi:hypothetical protein